MRTRVCRLLAALILAVLGGHAWAQGAQPLPDSTLQSILAGPLLAPASGNARAEVTVVEYFDYDCPVCRHLEPELRRLLAADPGVRIVHKDLPVFGEASEYAAYCALAAASEGRYAAAHDALILSHEDLDAKSDVRKVLRAAGFDVAHLDAIVQMHAKEYSEVLARNKREAMALGLQGTPGLIIGNRLVPGGIDYADLKDWVQRARSNRVAPH